MKHLHFLALPLLVVLGSGCYGRDAGPALFATGVVAGAVIATQHAEIANQERTAVAQEEWFEGDSRPQIVYVTRYEKSGEPEPPPPPPFNATHARAVLSTVDLSNCREKGASSGYGHAKVTINPSGDISKVIIDEPAAMAPTAAKCIGHELGKASVPVFTGSLVTVGTTWYVP